MPLGFLRRRKNAAESCRLYVHGRERRRENPLVKLFPRLYSDAPDDRFASLEELATEMEEAVADALHLLRLPAGKMAASFAFNCRAILRSPPIYALQRNLRKRGYERMGRNNHVLAALLQACASDGVSPLAPMLLENMMPLLLGIYTRYYGVLYLKDENLRALNVTRRFDLRDEKQREQREQMLEQFRREAEKVAETSVDRIEQVLGSWDEENEAVLAMRDVIRYSTRLMGRTAMEMDRDDEHDIHRMASYVGVLYSISSAQLSTGKRLCLILAEELARNRTHHKATGMDTTARYSIHALSDLLAVSRCHVLERFQGEDDFAIYSEPEQVYVVSIEETPGYPQRACFKCEKGSDGVMETDARGRMTEKRVRSDPTLDDLVPVAAMIKEE